MTTPPRVLFVCVKNGGKSQMAAGLMSDLAGDTIDVVSAGIKPGQSLNQLSVQSLDELGIDISHGTPKPVNDAELEAADIVITLGREATVEVPAG
ncbi:MAG: low molecular weight phosphatase family protein, partial [Brevibacterium sp.]|nr:low molecular weight phosphatase family protein [Brevibacterium sp.]